jgi:integrase
VRAGNMGVKRERLTDLRIKKLAAPATGAIELYDDVVPALSFRVTSNGKKVFTVRTRIKGRPNAQRFEVGRMPSLSSLADARLRATAIIAACQIGKDPFEAERQAAAELAQQRRSTFEAVADEFIERHVRTLRSARRVEAIIRRELIPRFGKRPLADISRRDIVELLREVTTSGRPAVARQLKAWLSKFFNWAIAQDVYGLENSPCDRISLKDIAGKAEPRQRVLNDREIRALWAQTETLSYPFGSFMRLLIWTGCRRSEASFLRWSEVSLAEGVITLEGRRTKNGMAFVIPLSTQALAMMKRLSEERAEAIRGINDPDRKTGDFVFSTTDGRRPIQNFSLKKSKIDKAVGFSDWVWHDIRRTYRTRLSGLPVSAQVAELMINHAQPGLHRVYDRYSHLPAKKQAAQLWAEELARVLAAKDEDQGGAAT